MKTQLYRVSKKCNGQIREEWSRENHKLHNQGQLLFVLSNFLGCNIS